jgi:AAA15 family ATPase/GTPase
MVFKSEVRDSTINSLLERARDRSYKKYLNKLNLRNVRGFVDQEISFDFPVTAIIGPNGGGKTTVLGAAAIIHREIPPRAFFSKSGRYDSGMQDWTIEYEITDRDISPRNPVQRTASFKNLKWNRDALGRQALLFGVSRTVPASERKELLSCTSRKFEVPEDQIIEFGKDVIESVSRILGKDISGFKQLSVDRNGSITLLTGKTKSGIGYSEFHFGAGESSILRMIAKIELAQDSSIVLIEEIENGLHPIATIRLVEYLIWVAERKKIQVIFTTHSNEALKPLPSRAIWSATNDRLFQGKLTVESLRAITGQIEKNNVIYVEDEFAKLWVEAIIRQCIEIQIEEYEIHAMSGDGTAVTMNKYHRMNPHNKVPSMCIIDGDSRQSEDSDCNVFRLPGAVPESYIFDSCIEQWSIIGGKLSVALLQDFNKSDSVLNLCRETRIANKDVHLLFAQLGEKIGLIPESTVANAFLTQWAQNNRDVFAELIKKITAAGRRSG